LKAMDVDSICLAYGQDTVMFYDILGSLQPIAEELGLPNVVISSRVVRHRLIEDETMGPVILPCGEVCVKGRGKNSGDGRTTACNTAVHQIVGFTAGHQIYDSLDTYLEKVEDDRTGDDLYYGGEDYDCFDEENRLLLTLGWESECEKFENMEDADYLSTSPLLVELRSGEKSVGSSRQ